MREKNLMRWIQFITKNNINSHIKHLKENIERMEVGMDWKLRDCEEKIRRKMESHVYIWLNDDEIYLI